MLNKKPSGFNNDITRRTKVYFSLIIPEALPYYVCYICAYCRKNLKSDVYQSSCLFVTHG